jgi:hypothetical protein
LLPTALTAALVVLGSTAIANAQYYDQSPSYDQAAPQDQNVQADPPDRVARLAYFSGDVEFAPAGEDDWGSADINRPLITGDRLLTGGDGRAALELGDAALRVNHDSAFNFLDLDDATTQVELSQGTLNLRVRRVGQGQTYEVDTPTVAFVADQPGTYRVDVAPNGNGAMVTVFEGVGTVYGENGVSRPVQAGQSYRFDDSTLANVAVQRVPAPDDFDRFCQERDTRYANSVSRRYVSEDVVGYDDLDQYGDWQDTPDYGEVWYPTRVAAGWAPYRDGHWAWIEPWGWTWVDDEPWGFAPFHYGRWVNVRNRWGWVPGPRTVEPVYAPALVAFVGGSGFSVSVSIGGGGAEPVGWFPLGPRDVYVPPYRASRRYFTDVNVTNIRNVYVNKTVINNYYSGYASGHPFRGRERYTYRNDPHAFTAVPRNVFAGARPVREAVLRVKPGALAKATLAPMPHVAPSRASLAIRPPKRPIAKPVVKAFNRTVVARHEPPPRQVPFAAREKVIAKRGGAPIPVAQLHQMRQQHAKAQPEKRVHVIAKTKPGTPANAPRGRAPVQAPRNGGQRPPARATIHPIQVPVKPVKGAAPRQQPPRPGEMPSARFAHPQQHADTKAQQQRAAQDRQRVEQARGKAEQARQNGERAQARQEQQHAGAAQAQAREKSEQAQQQAERARAQQTQQHARQEQQAKQQEQQRSKQQAQERAQQEHRQAEQQRSKQQAQQRAQQEHRQAEQQRSKQRAQQRAQQERRQAEQQRSKQQAQQRAHQQRQHTERQYAPRTQQRQHAPPPKKQEHKKQEQKKQKDHSQQDNGH